MKKLTLLLTILFGISYSSFSQNQLEGNWFSDELSNASIRVSKKDSVYKAIIYQSDDSSYVAKVLFDDVVFIEKKKAWVGVLTHPGSGIRANAEITFLRENELKVVGKKLFMTKTLQWKKLD